MQSPNKSSNINNQKLSSDSSAINSLISGVRRVSLSIFSLTVIGAGIPTYPLFRYNTLGFREKLLSLIETGLQEGYTKDLHLRLRSEIAPITVDKNDSFFQRVLSQREIVLQKFAELGIPVDIPEILPEDIFIGKFDGAVKIGNQDDFRIMFSSKEQTNDSTIRHEISHIGNNLFCPSWLREFGADFISESQRQPTHKYWINHLWAKALDLENTEILQTLYAPEKQGEDVHNNLHGIFSDQIALALFSDVNFDDIPSGSLEKIIEHLLLSSPKELSSFTCGLIEEDSDFWCDILGTTEGEVRINRKAYLSDEEEFDFILYLNCLMGAIILPFFIKKYGKKSPK